MDINVAMLKAESRRDSVEFPPFLANHLPMILVAMERLGASPERLAAFAQTYRTANGLVTEPSARLRLTRENWMSALGDRAREGELRQFFAQEVAQAGGSAAIATYLPGLARGIAGSAFHPLMRLSYAVMEADDDEIGVALAYWAATFLPLDDEGTAPGITADPIEVLRRSSILPGLAEAQPESDLLWQNMRAVARLPSFAGVAGWLIIGDDTLDRMAAASLALYVGTKSFEALHAVTGCHWLRHLQPVVPDMAPLLRHFWAGIASLMPKMGFPEIPTPREIAMWRRLPCPDWDEIKARALASDDEHDHSLVFSAQEEWRRTGDELYRVAAAKRLWLIG